jgi:PEGA domain
VGTDRDHRVPPRVGAGNGMVPEFEAPSTDNEPATMTRESPLDCTNEAFDSSCFVEERTGSVNFSTEPAIAPCDPGERESFVHVDVDTFVSEKSLDSSLIGFAPGPPLLSSITLPIARLEPYHARRDSLQVLYEFCLAAAAAGRVAVGRLRQTTDFMAGRGRKILRRAYGHSRMLLRRLPSRSDVTSALRVPRRVVVATACLASFALAVLAYVAASQTAPTRKREERVGVLSHPTTPPAVAPSVPAASSPLPTATPALPAPALPPPSVPAPPASSQSVTDNALAASSTHVPPVIATTRSPKPATQHSATRTMVAAPSFVGALLVTSEPEGAEVSVNGVSQGRTPLTISNLTSGTRVVSLSLPGYARWSWSVPVVANRQTPVAVKLYPERRSGTAQ